MKHFLKNAFVALAMAFAPLVSLPTVAHADPFGAGFGYDYSCPHGGVVNSGDYLSGDAAPSTGFPVCKTLPTASTPVFTVDAPTTRSFTTATAYQATTTTSAAEINLSITSTAAISLTGGTTNTADLFIGSTSGVASSGGTAVCSYSNANTGTLTLGLALNQVAKSSCNIKLPAGWYFAVRVSAGAVTVGNGSDQALHN